MQKIKESRLKNGLMVITDTEKTVESVTVAVGVNVGSINETKANNGTSHFLEHMAFKGTKNRTAKQICLEIENVGGSMNAYTSKTSTVYHIKVLKKHTRLALNVLSDIIQDSIFDTEELEKERNVILQELKASLDTPSDIVFDYFFEQAYGDSPLGRNILGTEENIKKFKKSDFNKYITDHYYPKNMVIAAGGNIEHNDFVAMVEDSFDHLPENKKQDALAPNNYQGGSLVKHKDGLQQMQFLLGFKSFPLADLTNARKMVFLSHVLSGGMSSKLFQVIREEHGLAYGVDSFCDAYTDMGMLVFYADSEPARLQLLLKSFQDIINETRKEFLQSDITRSLEQYKAMTLMSQENIGSRTRKLVHDYLTHGKYIDNKKIIEDLEKITISESVDLFNQVTNSKPTFTLYGDFNNCNAKEIIGSFEVK